MVKLPPDTISVTLHHTQSHMWLASRACTHTIRTPGACKLQVHAAASHATALPHASHSAGLCQESSLIAQGATFAEAVHKAFESSISLHSECYVGTSGFCVA